MFEKSLKCQWQIDKMKTVKRFEELSFIEYKDKKNEMVINPKQLYYPEYIKTADIYLLRQAHFDHELIDMKASKAGNKPNQNYEWFKFHNYKYLA